MRSPWFLSLFTAAALAAAPAPVDAQPRDPPRPRPASESGDLHAGADRERPGAPVNPRRDARRERLRQRIRAMRAWYLTEELRLDDATAARLFPLLGQYDDRLETLHQQGAQLRRELRREMNRPRPDPALLDRQVSDLMAHYEGLFRVQRERFTAVRRVVSPEQSAKLLLLLPQIDDAIRRQIKRAMNGDRALPRSRGGPSGDLDEPFPDGVRKKRARDRRGDEQRDTAAPFADPFR